MIAYWGCATALKFSAWNVAHLSPTVTISFASPFFVLYTNCSTDGRFFLSSTYRDTTTKLSFIRLFTEGSVHTFSSILRQFTQAHPVKSISTGLFCSLAI